MTNLKSKFVGIEPFNSEAVLLIGQHSDIPAWSKRTLTPARHEEVMRIWNEETSTSTQGRMFPLEGGGSIIWLPKRDRAVLVHEIVHAVHHILTAKGIPTDWANTETFAYLCEFLFSKMCTA